MLLKNTLFILGAAVSKDFEFPLGSGLRTEIANAIQERGRSEIVIAAMSQLAPVDQWAEAARLLCDALPGATSIDDLLHFHQQRGVVVDVGKIGIAAAISAREKRCRDHSKLKDDSSAGDLLRFMLRGTTAQQLPEALSRASFITFNYDRSLEEFLARSLCRWGIRLERSAELVANMTIKHAYGSIGEPFGSEANPFGSELTASRLLAMSKKIRTYTEEVESEAGDEIKSIVSAADRIVFLGCHPHPQNLALLAPRRGMKTTHIYGTVYVPPPGDEHVHPSMADFVEPTRESFRKSMHRWRKGAGGSHVLNDDYIRFEALNCRQLIARYGNEWSELGA